MNLQNGYKVIYEKIADGKRAFYATKNRNCDPTVDEKIAEVVIGEYKLIYEKDGKRVGCVGFESGKCVVCFPQRRSFGEKRRQIRHRRCQQDFARTKICQIPQRIGRPQDTADAAHQHPPYRVGGTVRHRGAGQKICQRLLQRRHE